jgi:hypothetical protein
VLKTCKSNGGFGPSGKRLSNAWVTYLEVGNNCPKGWLIPHVMASVELVMKVFGRFERGPRSIS